MTHTNIGTAKGTTLISNEKVIVTEWQFTAKGTNTGWHKHLYDYIVIPIVDGQLKIEDVSGTVTSAELVKGVPYFREKGVEHDVINASESQMVFVEVELLS